MITVAAPELRPVASVSEWRQKRTIVRVALLGLGQVGSAVVRLAEHPPAGLDFRIRIQGALVRGTARAAAPPVPVTSDPRSLVDPPPDVLIEVLGGVEPARALVLDALRRGIPVVTANKSLLAAHGDELLETSARSGVPLHYEATVLAGVPFLGTFARRPHAAAVTRVVGIVNGTTNFVLSQLGAGVADLPGAVSVAQRLGFAEADPSKDLGGVDAVEKLTVLIRHFGRLSVVPEEIERTGIERLTPADLQHAGEFGAVIKPVAFADWSSGEPIAHAGPAFVPLAHPLARLDGVLNGISLHSRDRAPLFFSGPGAGPEETAATILDDVVEIVAQANAGRSLPAARAARVKPPSASAWFIRLDFPTPGPSATDVADLLAAHSVWVKRTSESDTRRGTNARWLLTYACPAGSIDAALGALAAACSCSTYAIRTLELNDV